jgi:DNA invertase Pin-like site-specific DNA recombinase
MLVGYCRVSTRDQSLDLQIDALKKAGCEKIFAETGSGAKSDRAGLVEALAFMRKGDILCVWKLDRLGRSLKHLIETVLTLQQAGKGFRCLQENIDTSTSGGKLFFHIIASLAEFERDLIRERTNAGLVAARARGRLGGRPRLLNSKKVQMAKALLQNRQNSITDVCSTLGVSKSTLYRNINGQRLVSSSG